jgi:hypothetical protein
MSEHSLGWEPLLKTDAPLETTLASALFTTYDRADDRLLAEHLLPLLLRLERDPEGEGRERQMFVLELDEKLAQLHDRIAVVSSASREESAGEPDSSGGGYPWLWRSIRHLTVGATGQAVQHAKLWLLHWVPSDETDQEYLEIVVSSANLTLHALKGQVQAGWRACLPLRQRRSNANLATWGPVPSFLEVLGTSCGDPTRIGGFIELLARCTCPEGVAFVASVPGRHTSAVLKKTPWGAAGLREITPSGRGMVAIQVLSPFVGSWDEDRLRAWCESVENAPARLELAWVKHGHRWAKNWRLPPAAREALVATGARLLDIRHAGDDADHSSTFHEQHAAKDDRWSHSKIYGFTRGTSRRLLVTSANFSPAAWGSAEEDGSLAIANFELGVSLEGGRWPLELDELDPAEAAVTDLDERLGPTAVGWAQATWDGASVEVSCRCVKGAVLGAAIRRGAKWTRTQSKWKISDNGRAQSLSVPWTDARTPPCVARIACGEEKLEVGIFDTRPRAERETSVPPDVDPDLAELLKDELLFEQYGGRVADDEGDPSAGDGSFPEMPDEDEPSTSSSTDGLGAGNDSYAVPAFELARRHLEVVDRWWSLTRKCGEGPEGTHARGVLHYDARRLAEAFRRRSKRDSSRSVALGLGASLAADELEIHLSAWQEHG